MRLFFPYRDEKPRLKPAERRKKIAVLLEISRVVFGVMLLSGSYGAHFLVPKKYVP